MLVLRPRHRSLRSGLGNSASGGGGGGGVTASLQGKAAAFSAGKLSYIHPAILAGQILASSSGVLGKDRYDSLAGEDSALVTGSIGWDIGEGINGSAASFSSGSISSVVRSDALVGKAVTLTTGSLVYNAPPANISVLLAGKGITVASGVLSLASIKSAALTGKAMSFLSGATQVLRSDALAGQAAAFSAGVLSTGLYNVQASVSGNDVTITATSTPDLSSGVYGVEYGDGSGGVYTWSVNVVGGVAGSQSIMIGATDGVIAGDNLSYRAYYNLDPLDPLSTRIYGTPVGVVFVGDVGGITGQAITSATGHFTVVRSDALVGSASTAVTAVAGTIVVGGGSTANLVGKAVVTATGTLKVVRTMNAITGQAADFAPGPSAFVSEFDGLLLGQG